MTDTATHQPAGTSAPSERQEQSARNGHQSVPGRNRFTRDESGIPPTLEAALAGFLRALEGKNRGQATIRAYDTDVVQFIYWIHENNLVVTTPGQVEREDITEYLAHLAQRGLSGVSRSRKLAALREYFRFLEDHDHIEKSPATGVETPKKEKNGRTYLRPDEYTRMLSLAGGNPRDYAILQVFLQTGVRVSELCNLRLAGDPISERGVRKLV